MGLQVTFSWERAQIPQFLAQVLVSFLTGAAYPNEKEPFWAGGGVEEGKPGTPGLGFKGILP